MKATVVIGSLLLLSACADGVVEKADHEKEFVDNIVSKMTIDEKVEQMLQDAPYNERLGIPRMMYSECLHGLWLEGATVFPQAIALGSTWNPELIKEMTSYIAKEARSIGVTHCYSPNLDVSIGDARYGRIEESYGEDPYLVSRMGVAFIQGLQGEGDEYLDENHIIATAKHFVAYPENRTGLNGAFSDVSMRRLREIHFPSFEAAVKEARVASLMPAHQDLNGVPCHANSWLINDILRKEWGFDGFLISDNTDVGRLRTMHKIASNKTEAAVLAMKAGVDMELVIGKNPDHLSYTMDVLEDTLLKDKSLMKYVDANVKRIITAKYRLGMFESAPPISNDMIVESSEEAQQCALDVARNAVILLKNDNNILPLDKSKIKSIAVIGPNASETIKNNRYIQTGSYSGMPPYYTSVLEGIKNKVGDKVKVNYAEGCDFFSNSKSGFSQAVNAARNSDVVVLAVGGCSLTCGEGHDRDNINLVGVQSELIEAISKTGKPVVMIMINGRPLDIEKEVGMVDALIEGWYLGMRTGDALADVIFGDYNPGGKLTVSFPRNVGQLPVTYLQKPDFVGSGKGQYQNSSKEPLFHFGYGMSYTKFEYSEPVLSSANIKVGESVKLKIDVKNIGEYDGDEIVQIYIKDDYASVGRYNKMLKAFDRVHIKKGETKTVEFELTPDKFELYDVNMKKTIEPGTFTIFVGSSSREQDLKQISLTVK